MGPLPASLRSYNIATSETFQNQRISPVLTPLEQAGSPTMQHFGEHLTVDAYHCSALALDSEVAVAGALADLASILSMRALSPVSVYRAPGGVPKDPGGWSGFLVVMESHISIHTFPARKFLSADVYTCQNGLDTQAILDFFRQRFGADDIESNLVIRGTRYPKDDLTP